MTFYVRATFKFYWSKTCKNSARSQIHIQDKWWKSLIKIAKRRFLSVWTCAVKHLIWCVHSLLRLKAARPPLIICQVSKKGGFELHRMAEHLGPSSSVWNPRADKQIKCGTAGEDRRESFKQISPHVEARGLPNVFMSRTPKKNTQTSVRQIFFYLPAQFNVWVCFFKYLF